MRSVSAAVIGADGTQEAERFSSPGWTLPCHQRLNVTPLSVEENEGCLAVLEAVSEAVLEAVSDAVSDDISDDVSDVVSDAVSDAEEGTFCGGRARLQNHHGV